MGAARGQELGSRESAPFECLETSARRHAPAARGGRGRPPRDRRAAVCCACSPCAPPREWVPSLRASGASEPDRGPTKPSGATTCPMAL